MTRVAPLIVLVVLLAFSLCWAGDNSAAKVAVHVKVHNAKQTCQSLPSISECSDITITYEGSDFDFFPVFFNLTEYVGVEYGVTWPSWSYSCAFTSCSDLVIGSIEWPGDGISQAWTECQYGAVAIPGWGWLYADSAGLVSIVEHPRSEVIKVLDCNGGIDGPMDSFRAGVYGATGDDPCGEGEDRGGAPAVRIMRVIEVTDGSTIYMQPVWAPDGNKLAFTKLQFSGIYVRNADGSGPIQEITSADYSGYQPVWTSDSRGIVIRTRTGIVGQRISYIDVETGEVKVLEERALHPEQPKRNVYGDVTIDVDGQAKVLDNETASLESKDGYYSNDRPASRDLRLERDERDSGTWVVIEGDGTRRMDFPHRALLADLSPTRDRVAFLQGDGNLYVSHLDGSGKVSLDHDCI